MMYSPKIAMRIGELKAMHETIISEVNDEELIYWWLTEGVPDEPQESDFAYIASNDQNFEECKELYEKIRKLDEEEE